MTVLAPAEACPAVACAAYRVSPAKLNILIATHGANPPMSRISDPAASWVLTWVAPDPTCPAPSSTETPMLRMMTRSSLETTIAATNSIHLRTQLRVRSEVAPANASGARTAEMSSIILRIIIAAHTTTTAQMMTTAKISVTAGFSIAASFANVSFDPSPAMLVPIV